MQPRSRRPSYQWEQPGEQTIMVDAYAENLTIPVEQHMATSPLPLWRQGSRESSTNPPPRGVVQSTPVPSTVCAIISYR